MPDTIDKLRALAAAEALRLPHRRRLKRTWLVLCPRCGEAKLVRHFADDSHVCDTCAAQIDEHGDAWLWKQEG
jgi:uncharacterized protein (DUF983 family)